MKLHKKSISKLLSFALAATGFLAPMIIGTQSAIADTTEKPWSALAKSHDGSKLIAGTWGQGLFISPDSGTSWIQVTPDTSTATNASSATPLNSRCYAPFIWTAVAISNDGQTLVGGSWGCGLWVSVDGGLTWSQRSITGSGSDSFLSANKYKWYSVALSPDGSQIFGVNQFGGLHAGYTNASTLTALTPTSNGSITQLLVTENGVIFGKNSQYQIYKITVNLIAGTYEKISYIPNISGFSAFEIGAIDVVPTGETFTIYAAGGAANKVTGPGTNSVSAGRFVVSRDGGTSWSIIPTSQKKWLRVSASSDGQKIIGIVSSSTNTLAYLNASNNSNLYISTDSGTTWSTPTIGSTNHHWSEVDVLPDGSFIAIDGQETPFYPENITGSSSAWNPLPTNNGSSYTTSPIPYTGNIWRSDTNGTNWVVTDPSFFGGPTGRATLRSNETSTAIYDPNGTLGQPKLVFASAAPGATVTVTPTTDPNTGSDSPFSNGARIIDIAVSGVTGDTEICVDGTSSERMWHYRGSWQDITTSHTSTQVCGTTSSFSPFAVGPALLVSTPSAPSVVVANENTSNAFRDAREIQERAVVSARNEINNSVASGAPLKVNQFLSAGFTGVTAENIDLVNADIAKLNEENKQDLQQIEKIVLKYATVDKVAQGKTYSSYDLVSAGLIPQDSKIKTSILSALKKLPASDLDTYEKIQAAVAKVEKQAADRKERLTAILAKKR